MPTKEDLVEITDQWREECSELHHRCMLLANDAKAAEDRADQAVRELKRYRDRFFALLRHDQRPTFWGWVRYIFCRT